MTEIILEDKNEPESIAFVERLSVSPSVNGELHDSAGVLQHDAAGASPSWLAAHSKREAQNNVQKYSKTQNSKIINKENDHQEKKENKNKNKEEEEEDEEEKEEDEEEDEEDGDADVHEENIREETGHGNDTFGLFSSKTMSSAGAIKITNGSQSLTIDIEQLVANMSHPTTGVTVKDRKWRLKKYKKCFVGIEAVDWLVAKLGLTDRDDAVSVGQELMRLQYFRHVVDDNQKFNDSFLFYQFLGTPRPDHGVQIIRSLEELSLAISNPTTGVKVQDRKWHFRTYPECFVGSELVDWLMSNLPLRTRDEATQIGKNLLKLGYIKHVVDENKNFKDRFLFYEFCNLIKGKERQKTISESNATSDNIIGQPTLTLEDFELLKVLGVGAFGKVILVRKKDTGSVYAMKTINKTEVAVNARSIRNLKAERDILKNDHPFLVHLHFSFQNEERLFLVMDYISGGDLFFHLRKKGRFSEKEAQFFAAEIVLGLEYLHSFGIIYRDLKPENVLFDKHGHICLTDFGISKDIGEAKTKTLCGTPSYLAPEILKGEPYDQSVDWWSLGILILEMVTGRNPFRSKNIHQTMQWILNKPIRLPEFLEFKTADFITRLLSRDPQQRLGCGITGAREVKCHSFLTGTNWTDLAVKKVKSPLKLSVKTEVDTTYFSSEFTKMSLAEELSLTSSTDTPTMSDSDGSSSTSSDVDEFKDWSHTTPTTNLIS